MLITVFIILGAFLLVVQTTIFVRTPQWLGNPDLLFLLVLFMATKIDNYRGIILTMIFGLMMDTFSGFVPGLFPAVYLGLFVTIRYVSRHVIIDEPTHQPPLAAACYLTNSGAIYLYMTIFNPSTDLRLAEYTRFQSKSSNIDDLRIIPVKLKKAVGWH